MKKKVVTIKDSFVEAIKELPNYEKRDSQLEMVETIANAIDNNTNAIIEAGTGSGKSFAYLYPLIKNEKTAVISTGTIALQEQILEKDIPFLKKTGKLPEFKAVIAKGRSNYICKQKMLEMEKTLFPGSPLRFELDLISKMGDKWDGDFSTLPFQISKELKREIESASEDCISAKCEFFKSNRAPFFNARREMAKANLIITNHALYMIDIMTEMSILPKHDTVVFDEAHHLYMNAVKSFTAETGRYSLQKLLQKIQKRVNRIPDYIVSSILNVEVKLMEWVFSFGKPTFRITLDNNTKLKEIALEILEELKELKRWLEFVPVNTEMFPDDMEQIKANTHKQNLLKQLANVKKRWDLFAVDAYYEERVYWVECNNERGYFELKSSPLFVEQVLDERVWDRILNDEKEDKMKCIFTSATISVDNSFKYFKKQLGLKEAYELILESPFDYANQAALFVTGKVADPNSDNFLESCRDTIIETLKVSEGRAFLLFSSWRNMETAYELLKRHIPFPARKQGDLTRKGILDWFKETPNSVLFATATFWEGIDIPGDDLSCVIIDKLPFSVPDDPVIQAKVEYMKANNLNWFMDFMLPEAIIKLRQGVGRLIRTKTDKGLLVILDNRIVTKFYGKTVLKSLPPVKKLKTIQEAKDLFE